MTYVYEYQIQGDNVKVEYCFSSVSDSIKVVDMSVNGKYHRVNWMSHEGRDKLMARLEADMEDRMCGNIDDMTVSGSASQQDEYAEGGGYNGFETEIDLERDVPEFVEEEHYLIGHS